MIAAPSFLADALLPPLQGGRFGTVGLTAVPILMMAAALGLYLWGVVRNDRLHPRHPWPRRRTAAFAGGIAVTAVAVLSFIGAYDGVLFWDHMIQHLLLIMVAGALFAVGSPIDLAWRATAGVAHCRVGRVLRSGPANAVGHPIVAYAVYALVIPLTHLTSLYNYTLVTEQVHDTEHLVYLVVGYLFFRQIFGSDPNCYRMHPALQALYLFVAVPIDTFVGLSLDNETREIFPAYTAMHRQWGVSLVQDLHIGGVIMWVGGDTLMMLALIPVALQWLRLEERKALRADRELDAEDAVYGDGPDLVTPG
ncbi:MAG: cytochrome c oxidase assembly protein [Acidimicrobiales bacterium]